MPIHNKCLRVRWIPKSCRSTSFLTTAFSLSLLSQQAWAQEAVVPPLEKTNAYSLFVESGQSREQGYFPMGFVHGSNERAVSLGFNLQQGLSSAMASFAHGTPLSPPSIGDDDPFSLRVGMRNMSMARPAEGLGAMLRSAASRNETSLKSQKYGEFKLAYSPDGTPRKSGAFSSLNLFDPVTRQFLVDYAREHVRVRTQNNELGQTVAMWGLDNEWEGGLDYSPEAYAAFKPWLERTYNGQISQLNASWNTSFKDFSEAITSKMPKEDEYKANPGQFLDWMNFQTENFVGMIAAMAQAMHEQDPLKRGVILKSTQQTIEMPVVNRQRTFDHALIADLIRPYSGGLLGIDIYGAGDREAYEVNYIANCIRPNDFWTNSSSNLHGVFLGEANNHSGPGHQFASTYWRVLSNGLKGVNYFTLGFAGAQHDWDTFGFTNPKTGEPKDKLFYAARWANMVHRSEKFWTQNRPATGVRRVALLMPRRDVLLSDKDPAGSRWAYPENNRSAVFRWLREQGYWVDVIPYTKLNAEYLQGYQGLFLVGAEHLSSQEANAINNFVQSGGTLVADARAGYWDEHHRVANSLQNLLGVKFPNTARPEAKFTVDKTTLIAKGVLPVMASTAKVLTSANQPTGYLHKVGTGNVFYFPFELGTLAPEKTGEALPKVEAQGPTADNADYAAFDAEFVVGQWFAPLLKGANLFPAYRLVGAQPNVAGKFRIEQPVVDNSGNCAIVVSNRAQAEPELLPATSLEIALPAGDWQNAFWASAEDNSLQLVPLTKTGTSYRMALPPIRTAGVLYLFQNHAPMLGVGPIRGTGTSIDGANPQVKPGHPFKLQVQLLNPNSQAVSAGTLKVKAVEGWNVFPSTLSTVTLDAGEKSVYEFQVTPEANDALIKPNWIYPVVAKWEQNGQEKAVITTNVEVVPDGSKSLKLLSDNVTYPATYPHLIKTGMTYSYLNAPTVADPASAKTATGQALTNGFGSSNIGARNTSRSQTKNLARFNSTSGEILFDLKKPYRVRQLVFVPGPGANAPTSVQVFTSKDGQQFQLQATVPLNGTRQEIRTPLFDSQTQFVRAKVTWPKAGGLLDEVEIFGNSISTP